MCIIWKLEILQSFFPESASEYGNRRDDERTECTYRTENSDNNFLRDDISVEHHATHCHDSDDPSFRERLPHVSWECEECEDRIDDESHHRKCYMKITERKYDRTRILEDATTRECARYITWHRLEGCRVRPVPVLVCRDGEIEGTADTDEGKCEDDEVFAHGWRVRKNNYAQQYI